MASEIKKSPEENLEPEKNEVEISRRSAMRKLIGVLGLSLFLASPDEADAQARLELPKRYTEQRDFDAQIYEQYKEAEPYMDEKELEIMQKSQEAIFRHYINPGFINYLERAGYREDVDKILDIAIQHPFYLEYKTDENGVTEISKRTKMPEQNNEDIKNIMNKIPEDFYIKMEDNYITQVSNRTLIDSLVQGIPYFEGEYDKSSSLYWNQFLSSLKSGKWKTYDMEDKIKEKKGDVYYQEKQEKIERILRGIFSAPNERVRRVMKMYFITLPKRLNTMLEMRNFNEEWQRASLEEEVKNIEKIETYDDLIEYIVREHQMPIYFDIYDEYPDLYFINMGTKDNPRPPIVVTREGYLLDVKRSKDDKWKPDLTTKKKYERRLMKRYKSEYSDNPRISE